MWRNQNLYAMLVGMHSIKCAGTDTMENSTLVPHKVKLRITIWSSNSTSGHVPKRSENRLDTCTPMFIAALFTTTKRCKQAKCLLTDEWINNMWYTAEYHSTLKREEIDIDHTWMNLKIWCQAVSGNRWWGYTATWMCLKSLSLAHFGHSVISDSATPCTAVRQASLSITNHRSLLKLMFIESVILSNHLILCRPLFPLTSIFPSIRVFSNESVLRIRWPTYWSFSWTVHLKMLKIVNPMLCIFYHN